MFDEHGLGIPGVQAPADQDILILKGNLPRSAAPADPATPGRVQARAPFHLGLGEHSHVRAPAAADCRPVRRFWMRSTC